MKKPIPHIDLWPGNRAVMAGFLRDLKGLYRKGAFSGGPYVERFEKEFAAYLGSPHCVGVNSGTSALHLALLALGIGPGDEVIVPAYTFAGTVWGVVYCGATPVFADVDAATGNLSPDAMEKAITKRTRAVIAVHLFGQAADLAGIRRATKGKGIRLIEDAAQAHGGRHAAGALGALADIGCFSFYPTKNLGAANRERTRIAKAYLDALAGGPIAPLCAAGTDSAWHAFVCKVPRRAAFLQRLAEDGIGHAIYYPRILPDLPAFKPYVKARAAFPNATLLSRTTVSLPLYPGLKPSAVRRICEVLRDWR
jgi:dTDP-4-amino-4,6-dideoxygalactose transaminase